MGTATGEEADVIWHVVRFDFTTVDEDTRREVEEALAGLAALDEVSWLRVARDIEEPTVTGLLTGFEDVDALARYRVHPDHVPVVEWIRSLGIGAVRLDVATDDATDVLA
ncbi:MAG: Dabb family protein [Nitriliruptoraceae bacterium]